MGKAGAGIKIGVIDTGIDQTHPFLTDNSLTPPAGPTETPARWPVVTVRPPGVVIRAALAPPACTPPSGPTPR